MASRRSTREPGGTLPRDVVPCVWMSAGLVAYKLCDHDLDCESCPFDEAMRGVSQPRPASARRPGPWVFPDDRLYHAAHVWARRVEGRPTRIGLDVFAARASGEVTAVILPEEGTSVHEGEIAGWIVDRSVAVPFPSPVAGTAVRRNPDLSEDPALAATAPYDAGWLVEVLEEEEAPPAGLMAASALARLAEGQLAELRRQAAREIGAPDDPDLGTTLTDGGDLLHDLRARLGARRFHRLLERLSPARGHGRKRTHQGPI